MEDMPYCEAKRFRPENKENDSRMRVSGQEGDGCLPLGERLECEKDLLKLTTLLLSASSYEERRLIRAAIRKQCHDEMPATGFSRASLRARVAEALGACQGQGEVDGTPGARVGRSDSTSKRHGDRAAPERAERQQPQPPRGVAGGRPAEHRGRREPEADLHAGARPRGGEGDEGAAGRGGGKPGRGREEPASDGGEGGGGSEKEDERGLLAAGAGMGEEGGSAREGKKKKKKRERGDAGRRSSSRVKRERGNDVLSLGGAKRKEEEEDGGEGGERGGAVGGEEGCGAARRGAALGLVRREGGGCWRGRGWEGRSRLGVRGGGQAGGSVAEVDSGDTSGNGDEDGAAAVRRGRGAASAASDGSSATPARGQRRSTAGSTPHPLLLSVRERARQFCDATDAAPAALRAPCQALSVNLWPSTGTPVLPVGHRASRRQRQEQRQEQQQEQQQEQRRQQRQGSPSPPRRDVGKAQGAMGDAAPGPPKERAASSLVRREERWAERAGRELASTSAGRQRSAATAAPLANGAEEEEERTAGAAWREHGAAAEASPAKSGGARTFTRAVRERTSTREQRAASQRVEEPVASQRVVEPAASQRVGERTASQRVEEPAASQRVEEPAASQRVEEPVASQRVVEPAASQRVGERTASQRVEEPAASQRVEEPAASQKVEEPAASKRVGERTASQRVGERTASQRVVERTASQRVEEPAASQRVGERTASQRVEEPAASQRVGEPAASQRVGEPAASGTEWEWEHATNKGEERTFARAWKERTAASATARRAAFRGAQERAARRAEEDEHSTAKQQQQQQEEESTVSTSSQEPEELDGGSGCSSSADPHSLLRSREEGNVGSGPDRAGSNGGSRRGGSGDGDRGPRSDTTPARSGAPGARGAGTEEQQSGGASLARLSQVEDEDALTAMLEQTQECEQRLLIRAARRALRRKQEALATPETRGTLIGHASGSSLHSTHTGLLPFSTPSVNSTPSISAAPSVSSTSAGVIASTAASNATSTATSTTKPSTLGERSGAKKIGSVFDREDETPRRAGPSRDLATPKVATPAGGQARLALVEKLGGRSAWQGTPAPRTPGGGGGAAGVGGVGKAKQRLLEWCRSKTRGYKHVDVRDLSSSWSDGLAFCALVHNFFPDEFDFSRLEPHDRRHNFTLAFSTAERLVGCCPLLDVEDLVGMGEPDWKCVFTYLHELYRALAQHGLVSRGA
uniref:Smoothelin-like n=1 Tax=Petromyzon marinus TaxID=7757 RepID=A0AAJ7XG97_PETMA|nr:smoothelin-like [Petromyzon marinus]